MPTAANASNASVFGSILFRLEKTAYRYASITLAIIVLIPRTATPWAIALHRLCHVSVGILVGELRYARRMEYWRLDNRPYRLEA